MACCDWETFEEAFLDSWRKSRNAPAESLIDWNEARMDWRYYNCTGGESAAMQLRGLIGNNKKGIA